MEPREPFLLFGYVDFILLSILLLWDVFVWKRQLTRANWIVRTVPSVCLFVLIPRISAQTDVCLFYEHNATVDGFQLLYIWFRMAIWICIGIIELFAFNYLLQSNTRSHQKAAV